MLAGIRTILAYIAILIYRGLFTSILLLFLSCYVSYGSSREKVRITTDKTSYDSGQKVIVKVINQDEQKTFIWIGGCSFTLEQHNGDAWEASPTPWSGCPFCGHEREIPHPLFLVPTETEEFEWNQIVTWCEEGTLKKGPALGRFRFAFRYAEDEPECRSSPYPLGCWMDYRNKKWHSAYSNEFTIMEKDNLQLQIEFIKGEVV